MFETVVRYGDNVAYRREANPQKEFFVGPASRGVQLEGGGSPLVADRRIGREELRPARQEALAMFRRPSS